MESILQEPPEEVRDQPVRAILGGFLGKVEPRARAVRDTGPDNIRELWRARKERGGCSWCLELLSKGVEEERGWPFRFRGGSSIQGLELRLCPFQALVYDSLRSTFPGFLLDGWKHPGHLSPERATHQQREVGSLTSQPGVALRPGCPISYLHKAGWVM